MTLYASADAIATVRAVIALGVAIRVDDTGRRLLCKPMDALPARLQADLCGQKWAIIAYLESASGWVDSWLSSLRDPAWFDEWRTHFDECAAVRECECGNSRQEAERIAFDDLDRRIVPWAEEKLRWARGDDTPVAAGVMRGSVAVASEWTIT